jgi:2-iminoacetate synthase
MAQMRDDTQEWIDARIKPEQIDKYLRGGLDFIEDAGIEEKLNKNKKPDPGRIKDILAKSLAIETLDTDETAALISVRDPELLALMRETGARVKKKVYDNRIVTFAPLYMGNFCVNNCLYCGFRSGNTKAERRVLTLDEVRKETEILAGEIGHKRLIVVYGEHPLTDAGYIAETLKTIYQVKVKTRNGYGQIRRANVNAAPMSIEELKTLKDVGIGTYQVFQETYHRDTYARAHPAGTLKGDYRWRLYSMHRAIEAGVDDVGLGALFGLYDWRFEVMALARHSSELEKRFGIGAHTISFPRIEPADNAPLTGNPAYKVSDEDFLRMITVIRLSVPHTGMIITAREGADMRRKAIPLGCTQTDASTKIGIGSYSDDATRQRGERQQFILGDTRSLDEVIRELTGMGYITSFCTAGYRCGRTGECILDLLRTGQEGKFCKLNAILTFREWLDDFASPETKIAGEKLILEELEEVKRDLPQVYETLREYYERIKKGERDLYF